MASNVFGDPVTDATVIQLYPGTDTTTVGARDRARVALELINEGDKATQVNRFVHGRKLAYGTGTSTLCMIYNATGSNLTFVLNHTWEGHFWQTPYPTIIQNGQWAGFLHVRGRLAGPSKEAVVYRGRNLAGEERDWMLAWNTTRMNYQNHVFSQTLPAGGFDLVDWRVVDSSMNGQRNSYSTTEFGCYSSVSVGSGSSPEFEGIMTLEGLRVRDVVSVVSESLDSKYEDIIIDDGGDDDEAKTPPPAAE